MLPRMRPPPKSGKRDDIPVFANIADSLSSADVQYFQTIHGQPIYDKPSLKTLYAFEQSQYITRMLREWDDLAHPLVTGNAIPASAYDPRFANRRRTGLNQLIDAGLRWVIIDLGAYNQQAIEILEQQLQNNLLTKELFKEGDGVIVYELGTIEAAAAKVQMQANALAALQSEQQQRLGPSDLKDAEVEPTAPELETTEELDPEKAAPANLVE